ncbi:carbohydrate esterase family 8 protein [Phlebiopsis gigantea 11061_1 CR5-6]|uniref:pectinesterase n=1 Tax=Phlebiopsis gigantea (strain 11061_1 CR5-6) TaxID=745531 RepID=A0A0C3RW44_PHLG1|nr:carbohydrate esterase family 8 protein [Phlebiopsis gigantea 11061_1 CR5-6]
MFLPLVSFVIAFFPIVYALSRTTPPTGSIVVNPSATTSGQFKTLSSAIASLPNDGSDQTIFMYPGTYEEQVLIDRNGAVTLYGYTANTMDFNSNQVVISHAGSPAIGATSDDNSGTLRVQSDSVTIYNLDIRNEFGTSRTDGQAVTLSEYGDKFGAYACRFFSYQDTLYANQGTQVYLQSYIEGGVDFIFGRHGQAYFQGNTIASKGAGCVTANGRESDDDTMYVFESNTVIAAPDAFSNVTNNVLLGRPWGDYAKVIFKNTVITAPMNKEIWSEWSSNDPMIDNILFAEYNSTGSGVSGASRPSFSTILTSTEAADYTIATVVGSDWASWVDTTYM